MLDSRCWLLLPNTKSSSCRSLMNFGYLTPGNGTACQMIYSLILICCHQSFKSCCIHQVNGDCIGGRKLLIVLKFDLLQW